MGSWFSSAEEEEEQNEDPTKSSSCDYDKYVNDNWNTKYKQKCPSCPTCASNTQQCPTCPTCPTCETPNYDKYVNDNWESKLKQRCPVCQTQSCDYEKYVNDNWDAKYKSRCPACQACNYSDYVKKSDYNNKVNELNAKITAKDNELKEYKSFKNTIDSIEKGTNNENYAGDFKNYMGKWFMIVNRGNKEYHVSTIGRHNGGGDIFLRKSYNKNNDLFTVDQYGHLICYGNKNTILASGDWNDAHVQCRAINDPAVALHKTMWCYEGGLIKFYSNKNLNWDIVGGVNNIGDDSVINIWSNDGQEDQKWDIVVKEGFEISDSLNISTVEKIIAVIVGLIVLFYIIKVIYGKSILESYTRGGYVNTKYWQ